MNRRKKSTPKKKESIRLSTVSDSSLRKLRTQLVREGESPDLTLEEVERYLIETYPDFDSQRLDAEIRRTNDLFEQESKDLDFGGFTPIRGVDPHANLFEGTTPLKKRPRDLFVDDVVDGRNRTHVVEVNGQIAPQHPDMDMKNTDEKRVLYYPDDDEGDYKVQDETGVALDAIDSALGLVGNVINYPKTLPDSYLQAEYDKLQKEVDLLQGRIGPTDQFTVNDVEGVPALEKPSDDEMKAIEMSMNENGDDYDYYIDPTLSNTDTDQSAWTRNLQSISTQQDRASINRSFGLNREFFEGVSGASRAGGNATSEGLSSGVDILSDIVENGTRVAGWFSNTGLKKLDGEDSKINIDSIQGLAQRLGTLRDTLGEFDFSGVPTGGGEGKYDFSGVPPPEDGSPILPTRPTRPPGKVPLQPIVNIPSKRVAPRGGSRRSGIPMGDVRSFRKKGELYPYQIPSATHKTNFINQIRNDKATFQKALHLLEP